MISRGLPAAVATAARVRIVFSFQGIFAEGAGIRVAFQQICSDPGIMRIAALLLFLSLWSGHLTPSNDRTAHMTFQSLVGMPLAAVTLPDGLNHRIIPPGTAVTMDFSPERVNFDLDAKGRITPRLVRLISVRDRCC